MSPKVSIITATYNNADQLKQIAENVRKQDYENIEYIMSLIKQSYKKNKK